MRFYSRLLIGLLRRSTRGRGDLLIENLVLRQGHRIIISSLLGHQHESGSASPSVASGGFDQQREHLA